VYWLLDGLIEARYHVHLANPTAMEQYSGLKYADDKHSAFWIARQLVLGILPEGYIYPKQERPVRELLRRRAFLVKHRTSHILALQSMIHRYSGIRMESNEIKRLKPSEVADFLADELNVFLAIRHIMLINNYTDQIRMIEKKARGLAKLRQPFVLLLTIPGIGDILAMTIMLEVGDIARFPKVGNFCSYCRCAPSKRISNNKKKGEGNTKNGNRFLAWALVEAVPHAVRSSIRCEKYYMRKRSETNTSVATKSLGNKLSRAIYYILRDRVCFQEDALFC
jgi:transposase